MLCVWPSLPPAVVLFSLLLEATFALLSNSEYPWKWVRLISIYVAPPAKRVGFVGKGWVLPLGSFLGTVKV